MLLGKRRRDDWDESGLRLSDGGANVIYGVWAGPTSV